MDNIMDIIKISLGIATSIMGMCIYKSEKKRNENKLTEIMNYLKKASGFLFSVSTLYAILLFVAKWRGLDESTYGKGLYPLGLIITFSIVMTTAFLLVTMYDSVKKQDNGKEDNNDEGY